MENIICDVCGTEYPETENQCPVCGCARTVSAAPAEEAVSQEDQAYAYVKGGRFSKGNVRKRLNGEQPKRVAAEYSTEEEDENDDESPQSNRGLFFVVIALLLAIIAVSTYIAVTFFGKANQPATNPSQSVSTTKPTGGDVPCGSIAMETVKVDLTAKGQTFQLVYTLIPANTTDEIVFTSTNDSVATVDNKGLITAVGSGNAVIKVRCGNIASEIPVNCNIAGDPSTKPTTQPTTKPNLPTGDFTVPADATIITPVKIRVTGTRVNMRKGPGTSYAKVNEAVTDDRFTVYATYKADGYEWGLTDKGWIARSFTVIVSDSDDQPYLMKVNNATPYFGDSSACEVSIEKGESFLLTVVDQDGKNMNVTWTMSKTGICSISGNKVTRDAAGTVVLTASYEGYNFQCTVNG